MTNMKRHIAAVATILSQIEQLYETYRKTTDTGQRKIIYHQIDSISNEASKYAIANEYDKLMALIGSTQSNAGTNADYTYYEEDIPSNQIENWAKIQSDRFKNMIIRGFHTELETVYEEYNMSQTVDFNKVYFKAFEILTPEHPYGQQTTLGKGEHLKNPSITNIYNYFRQWYVPNNSAICISGDIDIDKTIDIIRKYFGDFFRLNLRCKYSEFITTHTYHNICFSEGLLQYSCDTNQ